MGGLWIRYDPDMKHQPQKPWEILAIECPEKMLFGFC